MRENQSAARLFGDPATAEEIAGSIAPRGSAPAGLQSPARAVAQGGVDKA